MRAEEFVTETWGVEKFAIPLPIGDYLAGGSDEFAPPGNYQSAEDLHDEVYDQIDAGVEPQVVTVDPRTLLATQDWLSNAGGDDPLFDEYPDRPVVYQKAGKLYILDGHHRSTRAWKAGRPIAVYLFSDQQQQDLDESAGTYREIEFVCTNPDFCDATDPEQQRQLYQQLKKIPGVIPVYQDQSDYSAGQFSLAAIYQTTAQQRQIKAAARALGVAVDLARTVDDDYVDRAVRGELEGQITENSANNQSWKSQVVDAIKTALPIAQEIWFHGSRATGKHRRNSDTDILVVVPDDVVGDDYLRVVRTLQKVSTQFDNYDIQPTKAGHNIHLVAQEEGQLLWSDQQGVTENFADGKVKGKSRPGRVKRAGASCNGSVTDLRARAKKASGEKAKMYHWCANMKSGRNKNK